MRKLKCLLIFIGVFVALCVFNVTLGLAEYNKSSSSLLTLEALADGEARSSEASGTGIAICLQIHVQETFKKEKGTGDYCWKDQQGSDVNEGQIIDCTSDGATYNSRCNKTSCKTSDSWCKIGSKYQL
jgi:hypothetical protein